MTPLVASVEEVHERTCQQQQVRQHAEDVGGVLGDQEESHDREKPEERDRGA
jgi:hypothetical protein